MEAAERPLGTFYFTHSETVLPFVTLLGLDWDETPLKHTNYEAMLERKFRTSFIATAAANVAFVLYECGSEPKERVMTLQRERRIKLPQCDEELCSWQQFKKIYKVHTSLKLH